jgi:hypothetical protein
MSWDHVFAARSASSLDPVARHVLLVIATYTNDTGRTWVSVETLAADTGYNPASVRRILERVAKSTEARVIHRPGRSSLFDLAPWERKVRALGKLTPRPRARRTYKEPVHKYIAACAPVGDIPPAAPAAWARIADPAERAEALARFEQLSMEV